VRAVLGQHDNPDGPWGALVARLRQLLADLTVRPTAATALQVGPWGARLAHRGGGPLRLDLRALSVQAVLREGYRRLDDWRAEDAGMPGEIVTGPGWSLALPFGHGFAVPDGCRVWAHASFAAFDGASFVPVVTQA
jgi:hypothetical protein